MGVYHPLVLIFFPGGSLVKNLPAGDIKGVDPCVRKIPYRRKWQSTPVYLPGKSHGQRILAGYSPWGPKESDMTEHAHTTTHAYLVTSWIHTDPHIHTHEATP